MEYLLIDSRQRYIGTVSHAKTLVVGDIFENHDSKTYTVVGVNWSRQRSHPSQSLTVVPVNRPASNS